MEKIDKKELEEGKILTFQLEKRGGLIPVIVQDVDNGEVLMLAYANKEAYEETLKTGYATFWSTSRNELWTKGKTSGDLLQIKDMLVDCDQDAIIYKVKRLGKGACHTKNKEGQARKSCFYRKIKNNQLEFT